MLRCAGCNRKNGSGGMWPVAIAQSGDLCSGCHRKAEATSRERERKHTNQEAEDGD